MLLPSLIFIPFIGGILCFNSEYFGTKTPRLIALFSMGLTLALTIYLFLHPTIISIHTEGLNYVNNTPKWKEEFILPWIPSFGIEFHLELDGLSLLMVILTSILGLLAILCSWHEIQYKIGFFHLNLLWLLCAVIGIFLAMDLFLFFLFWEIMLVPIYFLIVLWGHKAFSKKSRITTATKFFIYTQASGLIMLISIIGLVLAHYETTNVWTFNYNLLLQTPMSIQIEYLLMLGFFIAFSVKMPVIPLHVWLPDVHSQAPTAGSVDLAGILIKTAAYGLLRFSLPLFPKAANDFAPIAMGLGIINIFYGAWLAFCQTDIKRLIAYANISHMGFILIAIYSSNQLAYQGAVVQMIAHSLSASGLFIICGQLYERLNTRDINQMGGLWSSMKYLPALSLFFTIATIGMPGTGNFVGEFMILCGSFSVAPLITVVATFGVVFSSVYSLTLIQRTYYGKSKFTNVLPNMTIRELYIVLLLVILLIVLGIYPQPILDISNDVTTKIQQRLYDSSMLVTGL